MMLDGQKVPGENQTVTITMPFNDEDVSGALSITTTADKGIKAKRVRIQVDVPFKTPEKLQTLTEMAERTTDGERHIYRISEPGCNAMRFNQGRFSGDFNVVAQKNPLVWRVSFELSEHLSTAEKKLQRESQTQAGRGNASTEAQDNTELPANVELTPFENVLKFIDDTIGPANEEATP